MLKSFCQHGFAEMQLAFSLAELLYLYKNLCCVLLADKFNSKSKAAYEELLKKIEGIVINSDDEQERKEDHINMEWYLLERKFQNVLRNSFQDHFLSECNEVKITNIIFLGL